MKFFFKTSATTLLILAASTASLGSTPDGGRNVDFELTGTVFDADTKQPIEGAYVVASYKILRGDMGAIASFCFKTKGMYTAKDGRYHFPVEKLDGRNPFATNAFKTGYFLGDRVLPPPEEWAKQDAVAYSGRDFYLKKQDPANPAWRFSNGEEVCSEARTRDAAAAGVIFMKLKHEEQVRLKAPENFLRLSSEQIKQYENLPDKVPAKK